MTDNSFLYDAKLARQIIETVGAQGTPPTIGFESFSVGLEPYLTVIDQDYLGSFVKDGGASFKLVIGAYGGGKTHFLYSVRNLAASRDFITSYVALSHDESPFHQLEKVYSAIIRGLKLPSQENDDPTALVAVHRIATDTGENDGSKTEDSSPVGSRKRSTRTRTPHQSVSPNSPEITGLDRFLRHQVTRWTEELSTAGYSGPELLQAILTKATLSTTDLESLGFSTAVREAVAALVMDRVLDYQIILQWLLAVSYDRTAHRQFGLLYPIDRSQALTSLRSLTRWIRQLGYPGLVILFDEAEKIPSLSSKQRDVMLSNLRELIDECGHGSLRGTMIFYAVPDETAFEGRANVYEALKQRLSTVFDFLNPTGVRIRLWDLGIQPLELLEQIGLKLAAIYGVAYEVELDKTTVHNVAKLLAQATYEMRFGDVGYKRLFVQTMVRALHSLRLKPSTVLDSRWAAATLRGSAE